MSRTKKSRKPASEPRAKPKLSKEALANVEKRVRKKTGKNPGNRQQEAQQKPLASSSSASKDPRLGSKKPIALGGSQQTQKTTKSSATKSSKAAGQEAVAAIRYAEPEADLAQQLADIEADEALQIILDKQEDDLALTEQEIAYFNELMERHQALSQALGITDETTTERQSKASKRSEDDLWDKLDNTPNDFSTFE